MPSFGGGGTVLVTGASGGIGRAIALRLARDGYDIVVHYHTRQAVAEEVVAAVRALGREARALAFDVCEREATGRALTSDLERFGTYYGVVCNAGMARDAAFPAMSAEQWDSVLRTNLDSFYNVLRPLVMPLVQRHKPGRIVTLASVAGVMGNRGQANYSAAKGGVIAASKALAVELAKRNITVNCVAPGWIDTEMLKSADATERLIEAVPMQRAGTPEEVAGVVSFLMSADASYVTRQVIAVNGGLC